jgi:hypothetical protein
VAGAYHRATAHLGFKKPTRTNTPVQQCIGVATIAKAHSFQGQWNVRGKAHVLEKVALERVAADIVFARGGGYLRDGCAWGFFFFGWSRTGKTGEGRMTGEGSFTIKVPSHNPDKVLGRYW